ncbi:beta-lactamase [Candidatus Koribacter versatilis Ellin345]|uniref:Beta-lactamase n=1 Tax=Koribacter versatilis (strain Ellin345) TaxID=204669 RepID=Q1IIV9_KORVE|nr:serine hydrolase domain-containing protein [Candidatus Koribacter versatilis]ABF43191.1 beta-lactamase [Candidatus Koribacter versatilis Ellin345]
MRILLALLLLSVVAFAQLPANELKKFYEDGLKQHGIVGSSLAVLDHNKIVFRDTVGFQDLVSKTPVDENTTFHWASVSKTFTGIAIMQLRDRGLLSLDDPIVKYVPEIAQAHDPFGPISAITIRQAMSHSAGFRDPTWPWRDADWQPFEPTEWSQLVAMMPYTAVEFQPGSKYSYSNLAVVFLGEIIERLSGDPYEAYMEKNVLRPLGMEHSYYDRSPAYLLKHHSHSYHIEKGKLAELEFNFDTGITRSNGGLNSPIPDMIKYLNFLVGDPARRAEYDAVLKRSSLEEMWKPLLPVPVSEDFPSRKGARDFVTTSFFVHEDNDLKLIGHMGWQNGFIAHIYIDPQQKKAYVVNYNTEAMDAEQNTRKLNEQLRDFLIDNFFAPKK